MPFDRLLFLFIVNDNNNNNNYKESQVPLFSIHSSSFSSYFSIVPMRSTVLFFPSSLFVFCMLRRNFCFFFVSVFQSTFSSSSTLTLGSIVWQHFSRSYELQCQYKRKSLIIWYSAYPYTMICYTFFPFHFVVFFMFGKIFASSGSCLFVRTQRIISM